MKTKARTSYLRHLLTVSIVAIAHHSAVPAFARGITAPTVPTDVPYTTDYFFYKASPEN